MAGCRPLTESEERSLRLVVRKLDPRERAASRCAPLMEHRYAMEVD